MRERRRHARYEIATRVDVRLAHPRRWVPAFRGNTVDVSREGLAVALYQVSIILKGKRNFSVNIRS